MTQLDVEPIASLSEVAHEADIVGIGSIRAIYPGPAIDEGVLIDGTRSLCRFLVVEIDPDALTKGTLSQPASPIRILYAWSDAYVFEMSPANEFLDDVRIFFAAVITALPSDVELVGPLSSPAERSTLYFAAHPAAVLVAGEGTGSAFPLLFEEPPASTAENLSFLASNGLEVTSLVPPPVISVDTILSTDGPRE